MSDAVRAFAAVAENRGRAGKSAAPTISLPHRGGPRSRRHFAGRLASRRRLRGSFEGFSYGFRPGRGAHDALDTVAYVIDRRKVNWIVDADIRKFFDTLEREWLMRFLEHRIGDRRVLRLIGKWLHAGVMEEGRQVDTGRGTTQGAVISPLLANIYLHYVLDLWVAKKWRPQEACGEMYIVRYADDCVPRRYEEKATMMVT